MNQICQDTLALQTSRSCPRMGCRCQACMRRPAAAFMRLSRQGPSQRMCAVVAVIDGCSPRNSRSPATAHLQTAHPQTAHLQTAHAQMALDVFKEDPEFRKHEEEYQVGVSSDNVC